jgi:hypothetical protein
VDALDVDVVTNRVDCLKDAMNAAEEKNGAFVVEAFETLLSTSSAFLMIPRPRFSGPPRTRRLM